MASFEIAVIAGDGIGREVIPAAMDVLDVCADVVGGFQLKWQRFDWGCQYYLETGRMMPATALSTLAQFDSILLGAVGYPGVPDHVSLWGLLLPIRQTFDQYVNLRPVKLLPGIPGPLRDKGPDDIDFVCVRENTEGEYSGAGGRVHHGHPEEVVVQTAIFTRAGTERIIRYTFEYARQHGRQKVSSATKSNAINHSMVFWDRFREGGGGLRGHPVGQYHVDDRRPAYTHPHTLDMVVGSNLSRHPHDWEGAARQPGRAGERNHQSGEAVPTMFEPVHGSAPDIAGKGTANPIASIWAGAMMLEHLGESEGAALVIQALEQTTAAGTVITPDLGGQGTTKEFTEAVIRALRSL